MCWPKIIGRAPLQAFSASGTSQRWIVPGLILLLALALVGCSRRTAQVREGRVLVRNVPYQLSVQTFPATLSAGEAATLLFRISRDGLPVDIEAEGRVLHVVLASEDFSDFLHVYAPDRDVDGTFRIERTFTRAGTYRVWAEVDNTQAQQRHGAHADLIAFVDLSVGGEELRAAASSLVRGSETTAGDYRIRLEGGPFVAGKSHQIRLFASRLNGAAVTPSQRVDPGIYFMVGDSFSFFRHGHALHQDEEGGAAPFLVLEDTFPRAGEYLLWVELFVPEGDSVRTVDIPFLLTVS